MPDVRLIDANALKVRMFRSHEFNCETGSFDLPVVPWHDIEDADTIDAVPVVRCRECIHYKNKDAMTPGENRMRCDHPDLDWDIECYDAWLDMPPDGFCHKGAKMDGGNVDG